MSDFVYHHAKILSVEPSSVEVLIERSSACSTCHNRGACSAFDKQEIIYHIPTEKASNFQVGEQVSVGIAIHSGLKAVFYAYVIPLVLLFAVFFGIRIFISSELIQVVFALGFLAIYYYILFLNRKKLDKKFHFQIEKL